MSSEKLGVRDGVRSGRRLVANPGAWRGWHLGKLGRGKQRSYRGSREEAARGKRAAGRAKRDPSLQRATGLTRHEAGDCRSHGATGGVEVC
jgi:hypothetical protein